ncbi:hypothetical protein QWY93_16160 [Echinicola jeungdonensis]|uniref:VLRF1 domain-containing protein n=1 Tax=Echinicola jeungdonensis TaxID=709343 RepID=A0ABV5J7C0_9BACT|nr:hypothetical protein [Echinicola jeungdonensis]MDN3670856.1 hypothetical protein [Echinicola jeungdonensis]
MEQRLITQRHCKKILAHIKYNQIPFDYQDNKHQMSFFDGQRELLRLRLPISLPPPEEYFENPDEMVNYVLVIIRSGLASVGYFENGENLDHKVFRAYMVRKKQGKSQIKHLKTKGKSRAGSRVRLGETLEFFEQINKRLQDYFLENRIDKIGISCSTTLIPFWFNSKISPPFEKGDSRILKIPKHIQQPTYEALLDANNFLLNAELKSHQEGLSIFNEWLKMEQENDQDEENDEDIDEDNW